MNIIEFEMWSRCNSRNVSLGEKDDTALIDVSVEGFVATYVRAENCEHQRKKLLEQLKSDGRYEIPVMKSK